MSHPSTNKPTRALSLTEDEALALLEICLHTRAEDDALKVRVMRKVGEICREFIQSNDQGPLTLSLHGDRSVRDALDALSHRRSPRDRAVA